MDGEEIIFYKYLNLICILLFGICHFGNCFPEEKIIQARDSRISFQEEILLYEKTPFTGKVVSFYEGTILQDEISYKDGLKDGDFREWYPSGQLASIRHFVKGKKEGTHKGWHENGNIRFYSHFEKDIFTGENFSWYPDGEIDTYFQFKNGNLKGFKQWRNGKKIFMNYVLKENERIGLYGGKLCREVKGDKNGKTIGF